MSMPRSITLKDRLAAIAGSVLVTAVAVTGAAAMDAALDAGNAGGYSTVVLADGYPWIRSQP